MMDVLRSRTDIANSEEESLWGTSPLNVVRKARKAAVASSVKGGSGMGNARDAFGSAGGVALASSEGMTATGAMSQLGLLSDPPLIAQEFQMCGEFRGGFTGLGVVRCPRSGFESAFMMTVRSEISQQMKTCIMNYTVKYC
jgi:hypothetical protein